MKRFHSHKSGTRWQPESEKALRLEVGRGGSLYILYGEDLMGFINPLGECEILRECYQREVIEEWAKDEMPVDETGVEWRGGEYVLDEDYQLVRTDVIGGLIYDFEFCQPGNSCQDPNICRHSWNNTPIMY